MKIEVTDEQFRALEALGLTPTVATSLSEPQNPFKGKWFIRTVTYHLVGEIVGRFGDFLELANASWVADSGRFGEAITKGTIKESEFVGRALVNQNSITDMFPWNHELPKTSK